MVNPQGFQMLQQMMQTNGDPMPLIQGILGNKTPEQLDSFFNTAKQMGISDTDIQQMILCLSQAIFPAAMHIKDLSTGMRQQ